MTRTREPRADITLGPADVVAVSEATFHGHTKDCTGYHNPVESPCDSGFVRHNQETLGSGCVCDQGCEACDSLADAFEGLRVAMRRVIDDLDTIPCLAITEAREALRLAEMVSRGR